MMDAQYGAGSSECADVPPQKEAHSQEPPNWAPKFLECLNAGRADPVLWENFDAVLSWLGSESFEHILAEAGYAEQNSDQQPGCQRQVVELIDQLVIANPESYAQLFPVELEQAKAKQRFRKLMGVFHPDRGNKREAWLNYRSERVNKAYRTYRKLRRKPAKVTPHSINVASSSAKVKVAPSQSVSRISKLRAVLKPGVTVLRQKAGSAEEMQKRIIWLVGGVAGFILLSLLLAVLGA